MGLPSVWLTWHHTSFSSKIFLFPLRIKLNTLFVSYKSGYENGGLLGLWWREWNSFCLCKLHWFVRYINVPFSRFLLLGVDIDAKCIYGSFKLQLLLKNIITKIQSPNDLGSREWIFCFLFMGAYFHILSPFRSCT